jgi:DNA polymerase delta subunit 1
MKSKKPQKGKTSAKRRKVPDKQQTLKQLWAPAPEAAPPPPPMPPPEPVNFGTRQTGLMGYFGAEKKTEFISDTRIANAQKQIRDSLNTKKNRPLGNVEVDVNNVALTEENFYEHLSHKDKETRDAALFMLQEQYIAAQNTYFSLRRTPYNVLFDSGRTDSSIMIVRKMPSKQDEEARKICHDLRPRLNEIAKKLGVDLDKYGYYTNLIKVRTKGGKPITYDDVEEHLFYLRAQIKLVKPRVIIAIGSEVATVLRQHLTLTDSNIGRKNWDGSALFRGDNIYRLRKEYQHITVTSIEEENFLGRIHLLQDPADFRLEFREKAEAEFAEDVTHALQAVYFPRLKPQSPQEEFNEYLLQNKGYGDMHSYARSLGVSFSQPTDLFFDRTRLYDQPLPQCYLEYLREKKLPLKMILQNLRYDEYTNQYYAFGRTAEGFLMAVHITRPNYRMWLKHKSFNPQPDQNRQIDFQLPDIDALQSHVIDLLHKELAKPNSKYAGLSTTAFAKRTGISFSWELKRPFRKFHKWRKTYLQISFREHDVKDKIVRIVEAYLHNIQTAECKLTALERFYYETGAYSHGWIEIPNSVIEVVQDKHTISDYEFKAKAKHVVGYEPFSGPHSALAKFVVADFDFEMKGQGGRFPISQQDPIIRAGVLIQEYGDPNRPIQLEYLRDPDNPSRVYPTGRSNYMEKAMFVLGVHKPLEGRPFEPTSLPIAPKFPVLAPTPFAESHLEVGQRLLGEWNDFITNVKVWVERVGVVRASAGFNSETLRKCLLKQHPPLSDEQRKEEELKANWKREYLSSVALTTLTKEDAEDAEVYEHWKRCIGLVRDYWHQVLTLEQFDALEFEFADQSQETIGSIQYNWPTFHPKPKTFFFDDERKLIASFCEYLRQAGVDLVRGHNIASFDIPYLQQRVQALNLTQQEYWNDRANCRISMGRCNFARNYAIPSLRNDTSAQKIMITKAASEVKFVIPDMPGVDYLDTLTWARKEIGGLSSHTLSYVASELVKDRKFDVPGSSIARLYLTDPERLSYYADQDVELTCRISNARNSTPFTILCSRIIGAIQIYELYTTGVQRKIHNILIRYIRKEGLSKIVFDENPFSEKEGPEEDWEEGDEIEIDGSTVKRRKKHEKGYKGATCIPPLVGLLIKIWLCWDFSALYPTIMIANGLSIDLMGTLSHFKKLGIDIKRLWTSGEKFLNYKTGQDEEWYFLQKQKLTEEEASKLEAYDDQPAGLAQCVKNPDGTYTPRIEIGALIGILVFILAQRAAVNAKRSTYLSTSFEYAVLDCHQLVLKGIANSTYGFTGCKTGKYAAKQVGAGVTFFGRQTLELICVKMDDVRSGELGGGDTDSIFRSDDYIDDPNKIFAPIALPSILNDPTSPLVTRPWVEHIQNYLNSFVPPPMKIVFEKAFLPMFMVAKKRGLVGILMPFKNKFTGKMCFESVKPMFSVKGVETTRRDQLPITQRIMGGFLKHFLITKEEQREPAIKAAVEYVAEEIRKLHNGEYDIYELVETRYHGKSHPKQHTAMVELCDRKRRRGDPTPDLGTRQAFIVIEGDKKLGVNKRVEDPIYAIEHQLQPDIDYVTKKICKPIMRFAKHLGDPVKLQKKMFPTFIKHKKSFIQSTNPLLSQMYIRNKCEFCGENAERDRVCQHCMTVDTPEFVHRIATETHRKAPPTPCQLCTKPTKDIFCVECTANNSAEFLNARRPPAKCELCEVVIGSGKLCADCATYNTPQVINRVLIGKRRKLEVQFEDSAKDCYPCLSIQKGDEIECHNFNCEKYFNRMTATIRLNQFKGLESEILSKLE